MNTAAQWFTGPNRRRSWIAVLVVAVVVGVAAVVWADRSPRQSQQATPVVGGKFRIEPTLGSAPTPRWTVRAADLSTDPGAVLLSAPHSLNVYYGNGTPRDAGTTIVAATAVPDSAGGGSGSRSARCDCTVSTPIPESRTGQSMSARSPAAPNRCFRAC